MFLQGLVAKIYSEPKRGIHSEFPEETGELSKAHLSRARTVLRHAPDLAETCLSVCFVSEQTLATTITRWPRAWFPSRPPAWDFQSTIVDSQVAYL
jgi:hypothetical protein